MENFEYTSPIKDASTSLTRSINLPKSNNYFVNSRGSKLHFRYFLPVGTNKIESTIFMIHGYGGHINHPRIIKIADNFNALGKAFFALDLEGHGYSEGERALFHRHTEIVEDVCGFISSITGNKSISSGSQASGADCVINCVFPLMIKNNESELSWDLNSTMKHEMLKKLPFYCMGNSLGGAIVAFASIKLQVTNRYKGAIMIAPSIEFKIPNPFITALLEITYATFAPGDEMPDWLVNSQSEGTKEIAWQEEVVLKQTEDGNL